jgi:hypothetical protein
MKVGLQDSRLSDFRLSDSIELLVCLKLLHSIKALGPDPEGKIPVRRRASAPIGRKWVTFDASDLILVL